MIRKNKRLLYVLIILFLLFFIVQYSTGFPFKRSVKTTGNVAYIEQVTQEQAVREEVVQELDVVWLGDVTAFSVNDINFRIVKIEREQLIGNEIATYQTNDLFFVINFIVSNPTENDKRIPDMHMVGADEKTYQVNPEMKKTFKRIVPSMITAGDELERFAVFEVPFSAEEIMLELVHEGSGYRINI